MISSVQHHSSSKALRLVVCATLALTVTSITTQVIASSAGQHEYGATSSSVIANHSSADGSRRITLAQARCAVAGHLLTGATQRGLLQSARYAPRSHSFRP